ncbi:YlxR family protein [Microbacterium sp. STN6]|uniref:YlxR family protein n=1 Tax=Microbacterium sp. STN6 TaxID=2995588 RepID=UPI002260875D|nr:YlxR family protein [Microbacterium sp. STN6]MCX7521214.1 YlxR family protein [Microbacterium sp. STN6]
MDPVRTCIGCRSRAPRSSLLRVVARDSRVVVDDTASLPGRGAWLHPTIECYRQATKRRAFGRALRVTAAVDTQLLENRLNGEVITHE